MAWLIVEPFIAEIGWAIVFAICLDPLRARFQRLGKARTAAVLTLALILLVVLPGVFLAAAILDEVRPALSYLQTQSGDTAPANMLHNAWNWAHSKAPFLPSEEEIMAKVSASAGDLAEFFSRQAATFLKGAVSVVFSLVLTAAFVFFFLRDADSYASTLRRALPFGSEQNEHLLTVSRELILASVTATLAIAAIQGLVGGVAFALLGIKGAVFWGAMMGLLSLVPVVGTALVWVPAAIWLAFSGSIGKALILAAVGVLIIGMVDNIVRPLFLSGKSEMNTLVLLISIMGGVSAFGFIGIVLGPLVAAILTALVETYHLTPENNEAGKGEFG